MRAGVAGVRATEAMARSRGTSLKAFSLKYVALGAIVAVLTAFVLSGIIGLIIYQGWLSESLSPTTMSVASFVSLFFGAVYAGRRARSAGWAHGALTGLLYLSVITLTGYVVFDQVAPAIVLAKNGLLGLALGAVAGTVGINVG